MYSTLLIAASLIAQPNLSASARSILASVPSSVISESVISESVIPEVRVDSSSESEAVLVASKSTSKKKSSRGSSVEPKVVTFKTEDGIELTANYFAPSEGKSRAPVAILVHDAGGDRGQMTLFAERLHRQGLAVLVPDFRGHGNSSTPKQNWDKLDKADREKLWSFAPRDLVAASRWIGGRREAHGSNITLVGFRAGCALAVYHAGRDSDVRAVVLVEPESEPELGFNLCREVERLGGLTTKVFTSRDKKDAAVTIQVGGTEANDGLQFIDIDLCKSKGEDLIYNNGVASDIAKWVKSIAFPKRGRR